MSNVFSENDFEILIATQNRVNLDFLVPMFPFEHFSNFNILIINQSENSNLNSDYNSVKVINIAETGLSKSRNRAIQNASKKICLIADDDVVFEENFEKKILSAFNAKPDVSIMTFNHVRIGDTNPQKKGSQVFKHNSKTIWNVNSIEIVFQLDEIKKSQIYFDEHFGLGSFFPTAEEFLFLKSALKQKQKVYFSPEIIVSHPQFSSGRDESADVIIYARAALFYKIYGNFAYGFLAKYVFFLLRKNYIAPSQIIKKYKIGLAGIEKIKQLKKQHDNN